MSVKKSAFRLVEVLWEDSEQGADWGKLEDILTDQGSLICRSAGYVVADKEDRIILASSITADETYEEHISHYIVIPKSCIESTKELRPKSPAKKKIVQEQQQ